MAAHDHRTDLRRELVQAAARRSTEIDTKHPYTLRAVWNHWRIGPRGSVAIAASLLAVIFVVAVTTLDSDPAAADIFTVRVNEDEVIVTVEGLVSDPASAAAELSNAGLDVTLVDVPVPPSLVGAVVGTTSKFGPLDADVDRNRIRAFRIPRSEDRAITIDYGRHADPGEDYVASEPVPNCGSYVGHTVDDDLEHELAERYGPNIVWQENGVEIRTGVAREDLALGAEIITVLPLSPSSVLVGVTDGFKPPPGLEC